MPRTRSSKEGTLRSGTPYPQHAQQRQQTRRRYRRAKKAAALHIAVMPKTAPVPIEISSDEETGSRAPRRRRNAARKCKREVIVISDDEDARPFRLNAAGPVNPTQRGPDGARARDRPPDRGRSIAPSGTIINDGSEDIAMYEARLASYELELASLRQREAALAKAAAAAEDAAAAMRCRVEDEILQRKAELAVEQTATHEECRLLQVLADIISCDICSERMFKPVTLDCGHTFCQSCVTGWFRTIEEQHRELHPLYDPATAVPVPDAALLQHLSPLNRTVLAEVAEEHPRAPYTCPVCRKAVGGTVECVMLKAVVDAVVEAEAAGAQVESGPKAN